MSLEILPPIIVARPHRDPITTTQDALSVCALAMRRPLTDSLIVLLLDAQRRGVGLLSVSGARLDEHVHEVIAASSTTLDVESIVVVECRGEPRPDEDLVRARQLCDRAGLALDEVIVVESGSIRRRRD